MLKQWLPSGSIAMAKRSHRQAVVAEAACWPGVTVSFEDRSKHAVALLQYEGRERLLFMSKTPSDWRSCLNNIADMRRELRSLGAVRKERP